MPTSFSPGDRGSDANLVKRARAKDGEAWAALVDRYSGYVYSLLNSVRVPESESADAFQYVFVELFKAIESIQAIDDLRPWIRQTTLRHGIRVREKAARAISLDEMTTEVAAPDETRALELSDMRHTVRECVEVLKPQCRELVHRLFLADPPEPYAEVAEALGIKVSSLSMTRQRCLDDLMKVLKSRGLP